MIFPDLLMKPHMFIDTFDLLSHSLFQHLLNNHHVLLLSFSLWNYLFPCILLIDFDAQLIGLISGLGSSGFDDFLLAILISFILILFLDSSAGLIKKFLAGSWMAFLPVVLLTMESCRSLLSSLLVLSVKDRNICCLNMFLWFLHFEHTFLTTNNRM